MTRMWKIDPELLCRQHLLGEHNELHKFLGSYNKGYNLQGYYDKGLIEVHSITWRHHELVQEMHRRGYKHKSPLPYFHSQILGKIDTAKSLRDLCERCEKCRDRILKEGSTE